MTVTDAIKPHNTKLVLELTLGAGYTKEQFYWWFSITVHGSFGQQSCPHIKKCPEEWLGGSLKQN